MVRHGSPTAFILHASCYFKVIQYRHQHVARATNALPFVPRLLLPLVTQLNKFATESELYRYIRRSYRVIEQAVYEKACSHSASTAGGHSNGAEPDNGGAGVDPFQNMACSEFLDTMIEQFSDNCGFDRLEDAVDR